jgi:hypothetical protein
MEGSSQFYAVHLAQEGICPKQYRAGLIAI